MNPCRIIQVRPKKEHIEEVIYIMHNTFRIENNHALFHALSFRKNLSIVIVEPFDKHDRTLQFFQKGTLNIQKVLSDYTEKLTIQNRLNLNLDITKNTHVVMDMYYLKEEKELYNGVLDLVKRNNTSLDLVETNTIVPLTESSNKEEYSARTIRTKIHSKIGDFLDEVLLDKRKIIGEEEALRVLDLFLETLIEKYDERNNPAVEVSSNLSPYLKYGFISPLTIYQKLQDMKVHTKDSFIEELIIRRDLAYNFTYYNPFYYMFEHMTYPWAYRSMKNHRNDKREYLYSIEDYITFNTHDPYFNTAMKEMVYLGKMHGYMRMYWAKKIIEWSKTYEEAFETLKYLNNYYFIDGNNPNGYAGIAWCFGKHDRAWKEREIFGKLRYMNQKGLERKFQMNEYINRIESEVGKYEK